MPDPPRPDRQQGVFETLLSIDGRPVELDAHLDRLKTSLEELFPHRPAPALADEICAHANGVGLGSVRATVAPADGALRATVSARPSGAFVSLSGKKVPMQEVAVHSFVLAGGLGPHKWADRSALDEAQSGLPGDALPLVVESDGTVLEASRANVFVVRAGVMRTPPTDGRILPGITRAGVMRIAATMKLETEELELSRDDLVAAEEVFLTGSVRGIERVRALDGTELAGGGEVSSRIGTALWRAWTSGRLG